MQDRENSPGWSFCRQAGEDPPGSDGQEQGTVKRPPRMRTGDVDGGVDRGTWMEVWMGDVDRDVEGGHGREMCTGSWTEDVAVVSMGPRCPELLSQGQLSLGQFKGFSPKARKIPIVSPFLSLCRKSCGGDCRGVWGWSREETVTQQLCWIALA